jgi:hypothetical protein
MSLLTIVSLNAVVMVSGQGGNLTCFACQPPSGAVNSSVASQNLTPITGYQSSPRCDAINFTKPEFNTNARKPCNNVAYKSCVTYSRECCMMRRYMMNDIVHQLH